MDATSFAGDLSDSYSSVFEPDVVLPGQFFAGLESGLRGGERRLMAAVLSDGIEAYIAQCASLRALAVEAESDAWEWVHTRDYSYVFSFDNVCESLGINADYLRLGLTRYVEAIRQRRASGQPVGSIWKKIRRPRK